MAEPASHESSAAAAVGPPRRFWQRRFQLWHVLFLVLAVGALLGAIRQGGWVVVWAWPPCCLLAWSICQDPERFRLVRLWPAVPTLALVVLMPVLFTVVGVPSWLVLAGWSAWGIWCAGQFQGYGRALGQLLPMLLLLACIRFPFNPASLSQNLGVPGATLLDARGGRLGFDILGLRLAWDGPETALIERLLGPVEPCWVSCHHYFPRSIVFQSGLEMFSFCHEQHSPLQGGLAKCLQMLPHDDARRRVLRSLTDERNVLRYHQAMLLICLADLGYPRKFTAESWWLVHAPVFEPEYDLLHAQWKVQDWRILSVTSNPQVHALHETARRRLRVCDRPPGGVSFPPAPQVVWWSLPPF